MFDANLMFSSAQVLADDAWSTNALNIKKTPAEGVWVEFVVTSADGVKTVKPTVYASDTDAGWAITKPVAGEGVANSGVGRWWFKIQTKMQWVKAYYDCSVAGAFTVTCGIVSGPGPDATA